MPRTERRSATTRTCSSPASAWCCHERRTPHRPPSAFRRGRPTCFPTGRGGRSRAQSREAACAPAPCGSATGLRGTSHSHDHCRGRARFGQPAGRRGSRAADIHGTGAGDRTGRGARRRTRGPVRRTMGRRIPLRADRRAHPGPQRAGAGQPPRRSAHRGLRRTALRGGRLHRGDLPRRTDDQAPASSRTADGATEVALATQRVPQHLSPLHPAPMPRAGLLLSGAALALPTLGTVRRSVTGRRLVVALVHTA